MLSYVVFFCLYKKVVHGTSFMWKWNPQLNFLHLYLISSSFSKYSGKQYLKYDSWPLETKSRVQAMFLILEPVPLIPYLYQPLRKLISHDYANIFLMN